MNGEVAFRPGEPLVEPALSEIGRLRRKKIRRNQPHGKGRVKYQTIIYDAVRLSYKPLTSDEIFALTGLTSEQVDGNLFHLVKPRVGSPRVKRTRVEHGVGYVYEVADESYVPDTKYIPRGQITRDVYQLLDESPHPLATDTITLALGGRYTYRQVYKALQGLRNHGEIVGVDKSRTVNGIWTIKKGGAIEEEQQKQEEPQASAEASVTTEAYVTKTLPDGSLVLNVNGKYYLARELMLVLRADDGTIITL